MNIIVAILLVFAVIGFMDKTFSLKWGLGMAFDQGFSALGTMLICVVGISSIGVTFIQNHTEAFLHATSFLPFDCTVIIGTILAPDMGAYPICMELAGDKAMGYMNGVILATLIGQLISFQIPVFAESVSRKDLSLTWRGFVLGLLPIPVGYIFAAVVTGMSVTSYIRELIPIIIVCVLLVIGLFFFTDKTVKFFSVFARIIQIIVYVLFIVAILGLFIPAIAYADTTTIQETSTAIVKSAIIVAGSVVLAQVVRRFFKRPICAIAHFLGVNEMSVLGLILGCATSLAVVPLFKEMDTKGKFINCAFSVSGAYIFGGQMGYISTYITSSQLTIYFLVKLICGVISILLAMKFFHKFFPTA